MKQQNQLAVTRAAIYTRKSTEEGLEQEFNTLDAQRESAEAYLLSLKHEGWECLPDRYDDGGYSGGTIERPALKRLMADIEAGKIDAVVVYKVDRLSRSLLDFSRLMETFEKHDVSFVSVTQQFNTANSLGRLMLNVLLSFAQFEREIISERTRDKMRAARRKGKYVGGSPILGYNVDREARRLVVNEEEAERVRCAFSLYLDHQSLLSAVKELNRLGWCNKQWTTKQGAERGGRPFNKSTLRGLLTNVAYLGKVKFQGEVFEGEHEAIVDAKAFDEVQRLLRLNHRAGGSQVRNRYGALLKGLLRCKACDCAMIPSHTKKGNRTYRYYVCTHAQKRGWKQCPAPSLPASEIEAFVIDHIRKLAREPELAAATFAEVRRQTQEACELLAREETTVRDELCKSHQAMKRLVADDGQADEMADLLERIQLSEQRLAEITEERDRQRGKLVEEHEIAAALAEFDPLWESLSPREQGRLIELLVERVEYDGHEEKLAVTFRPTAFRTMIEQTEEGAA